MKNNGFGQSAVISYEEYIKIRKQYANSKHKLIFDVGWYTGERWGCILQLRVDDVFNVDGGVKEIITFRARTRKASPQGVKLTRQLPVSKNLKEILSSYCLQGVSEWLFPGSELGKHVTLRTCDYFLRDAVSKAGLTHRGISTHSTRRSFVTRLARQGTDIKTLQHITGHQDVRSLMRYVDVSEDRIKGALELA
ncbi:MAG: phage integrase family protein [Richelia sp. RM1_1_1]|nr:phage integrase family protein [Richelia sp. RM1_1_1]